MEVELLVLADVILDRGEKHKVVEALRHARIAVGGKEFCRLHGVLRGTRAQKCLCVYPPTNAAASEIAQTLVPISLCGLY